MRKGIVPLEDLRQRLMFFEILNLTEVGISNVAFMVYRVCGN